MPTLLRSWLTAAALLGSALPALAADRAPPAMRLGDDVRPTAYALTLRIDPRGEPFSGKVAIDVDLARPLDFFWVHGTRLAVTRAVLETAAGEMSATTSSAGGDFIGVQLPRQVPAGHALLRMEFSGRLSSTASRGLFRQQDLGEWYAFSQFESTYARAAFPSFDEPHWKTPWAVTLEVPHGDVAVSNSPQASRTRIDARWDAVRFATTPPLPSYLVALGVGPFEVVDGGVAGRKRTPLRYIVPKGRAEQARYAREATPRILGLLEDYFGMPYPFEKLDSMAIPLTLSFGAMENPGLVTYRSTLLLAGAARDDERFRQAYAGVAAHELAHQWFGDLVTMRWWDDVWLNESFATWMGGKIREQFNPAWESGLRREGSRQWAMASDRLPSARQVRQPVRVQDDVIDAFDAISYSKGGALLRMYEQNMGEEAFRDAVRRYIAKHAWGNASAPDFFAAIGATQPDLARSFAGFVEQPGVPLVDWVIDCDAQPAVARLRQQRFLPGVATPATQSWQIPVCVRTDSGQACMTLLEREGTLPLPQGRCPAWALPNPAGTAYVLNRLDAAWVAKLDPAQLQPLEAVALVREQRQLTDAGLVRIAALQGLLARLAGDNRPQVLAAAAEAASDLRPELFTEEERARWPAWVREHFGPAARRIGWIARAGDSDEQRKAREQVMRLTGVEGDDPAVRAEALRLVQGWLAGDHATLRDQWREAMDVAVHAGGAPLLEQVLTAIRHTPERRTREELWSSLAFLDDDRLYARAFTAAINADADWRESSSVLRAFSEHPRGASAALRFLVAHADVLAQRTPEESKPSLPRMVSGVCTPAEREIVERLFASPRLVAPGMPRAIALTLQQIDICLQARPAQAR